MSVLPKLSCRCLCLTIARLALVLCGGGSGLVPPPPCPSSSSSTCVSASGTILSCLHMSICLSVCCLEGATWPLLRVSAGASETVVDLSASAVTLSLVLLPSESSISAPMQLYTILTRSVDCIETEMYKLNFWWFHMLVKTPSYQLCAESIHYFQSAGNSRSCSKKFWKIFVKWFTVELNYPSFMHWWGSLNSIWDSDWLRWLQLCVCGQKFKINPESSTPLPSCTTEQLLVNFYHR